jgi:hypothetical protein
MPKVRGSSPFAPTFDSCPPQVGGPQ